MRISPGRVAWCTSEVEAWRTGLLASRRAILAKDASKALRPVDEEQASICNLLNLAERSWLQSGAVYGYRKVSDDLVELGEICGKNRVYRLMHKEGIRAQIGYRRRPMPRGGPSSVTAPNPYSANSI